MENSSNSRLDDISKKKLSFFSLSGKYRGLTTLAAKKIGFVTTLITYNPSISVSKNSYFAIKTSLDGKSCVYIVST